MFSYDVCCFANDYIILLLANSLTFICNLIVCYDLWYFGCYYCLCIAGAPPPATPRCSEGLPC